MMSLMITSGWWARASSMPSAPSWASSTPKPSSSKFTSSRRRITGSSSTTSTVGAGIGACYAGSSHAPKAVRTVLGTSNATVGQSWRAAPPSWGRSRERYRSAVTTLWWWRTPIATRSTITAPATRATMPAMPAMRPTVDQAKALRRRPRRVSPLKSVLRWPVMAAASASRASTSLAGAPLAVGLFDRRVGGPLGPAEVGVGLAVGDLLEVAVDEAGVGLGLRAGVDGLRRRTARGRCDPPPRARRRRGRRCSARRARRRRSPPRSWTPT